MKWHSLSFIAILFSNFVFAQDNLKDSLLAQLEKASNDSNHIALLNQLSSQYIHSRPDSSIYYSRQAISLAKSTNDELGVIRGLRSISFAYAITGNFSEGLENGLDALKKSELNGDPELIAASLSTIGGVYSEQNDHQGAMIYGLQALKALEKVPESPRHLSLQINIGYGYIELNKLDSALLHLNHALELSLRNNNKLMTALVYMNLAMVNLKLKQYKQVEMYCGLCIPIFIKENNLRFLSSAYTISGELYDSTKQLDSAISYGRKSLAVARQIGYPQVELAASRMLASLFKKARQVDSSFLYQELAMNIKDSLTKMDKQKQLNNLTFNEQIRQQNLVEQRRIDAEKRKHNLQLAAIAIFIPLFLSIVLVFSRTRVHFRLVEFLGVLSLLFLFEFIVLLVHPLIADWTHESPVWMLLILVAIAAILVPIHHRAEKWIKRKIAARDSRNHSPSMEPVAKEPVKNPQL